LSDFQSDFTVATEDSRSTMTEGKVTVYVLLDFTKAFDLINHGLFVHKLCSRYDFHTSAMGMVSSFLQDRSMHSGGWGWWCLVVWCTTGRYLISCSCIRFSKCHFYADDLQIGLDGMISALNKDLAAISRWSVENGLLLNPRKSLAILISNSAEGMVLLGLCLSTEEMWCRD
jgi:hypothetical protein